MKDTQVSYFAEMLSYLTPGKVYVHVTARCWRSVGFGEGRDMLHQLPLNTGFDGVIFPFTATYVAYKFFIHLQAFPS